MGSKKSGKSDVKKDMSQESVPPEESPCDRLETTPVVAEVWTLFLVFCVHDL